VWPKTQPPYSVSKKKSAYPYGCFTNVLKTKDFTPLDPDILEHKFYAQGIGHIKTVQVKGGSAEERLVQIKGKIGDDADSHAVDELKAPGNEIQMQKDQQAQKQSSYKEDNPNQNQRKT
jgi:hypothetical protein